MRACTIPCMPPPFPGVPNRDFEPLSEPTGFLTTVFTTACTKRPNPGRPPFQGSQIEILNPCQNRLGFLLQFLLQCAQKGQNRLGHKSTKAHKSTQQHTWPVG